MRTLIAGLLIILVSIVWTVPLADAQSGNKPRRALFICAEDYEPPGYAFDAASPEFMLPDLTTPCQDTGLLVARLVQLGWTRSEAADSEIIVIKNPTPGQMLEALREMKEFLNSNAETGSLGLVYFAGHGVEVNSKQYMFATGKPVSIRRAAEILWNNADAIVFQNAAVELKTDVFGGLGNCFCDFLVIVDACRNDPVAFTRLDRGLSESEKTVSRDRGRGQILITSPKQVLLPPGLGAMYATSEPGPILDQSPTRLALMLERALVAGRSLHEILSKAAVAVSDKSRFTQYPQAPALSYASRKTWCLDRCPQTDEEAQLPDAAVFRRLAAKRNPLLQRILFQPQQTGQPQQADQPNQPPAKAQYVALYDPPDVLAARESGAISTDVFWCDSGPNAQSLNRQAQAFAEQLSAMARGNDVQDGTPLGSIRLRSLTERQNASSGYRLASNVVWTDFDSIPETGWANRFQKLGVSPSLDIIPVRTASPAQISVFFCKGAAIDNPAHQDPPMRLWLHIFSPEQRDLATSVGVEIQTTNPHIMVADKIVVTGPKTPDLSQVRYFYPQDRTQAERVADQIRASTVLGDRLSVSYLPEFQSEEVQPGLLEVWLGKREKASTDEKALLFGEKEVASARGATRPLASHAINAQTLAAVRALGGENLDSGSLTTVLERCAAGLRNAVTVPVTTNEFTALLSLCVNIGSAKLESSSLVSLLNDGDRRKAADAILLWDKVGGERALELSTRRALERDLFLGK